MDSLPRDAYHIPSISARINDKIRRLETLEDAVDPAALQGHAGQVAEAAKRYGFIIDSLSGSTPDAYLIGVRHAYADPDVVPQATPAGGLLERLLKGGMIRPDDLLFAEGIRHGRVADDGYFIAHRRESYLVENKDAFRAIGIMPTGADDIKLLRHQHGNLRLADEARADGRHDTSWRYMDIAAASQLRRDLLHADSIILGGRRAFLFIGNAHIFGGVIQARLAETGRQYIAFAQKAENPR